MFFPGLRNFAFCFFPFGVYSGMKRAYEGEIKSLLAHFFCCQLIANVPSSETEFNLYVLSCYEYQNLVIDHCVRQSAADQYLPRDAKFCV